MARIGCHGIVGKTRRVPLYVRAFSHNVPSPPNAVLREP